MSDALAVLRFGAGCTPDVARDAAVLLDLLAARPGFRSGRLAEALEEPGAFVLVTEWTGVGAWRRAVGSTEVKLVATPLLLGADGAPGLCEVRAVRPASPAR